MEEERKNTSILKKKKKGKRLFALKSTNHHGRMKKGKDATEGR